jgi:hypothetical protein
MPSHEETACLHSSLSPHPWESSHLFCLARKAEKQFFLSMNTCMNHVNHDDQYLSNFHVRDEQEIV